MKPKAILTLALLAFMAASVGYFAISEVRQWRTPESDLGGAGHRIGVYYFYFLPRCGPCNTVEALARRAVYEGFPEAV